MPTWLIIIILAVAAAGVLFALYRQKQSGGRLVLGQGQFASGARDYPKEREDARIGHLSEEDRAWETASLERNLANQKLSDAAAEQRL